MPLLFLIYCQEKEVEHNRVMNVITSLTVPENAGKFLLRLTLAGVIWPHGAQKVLGWFGGYGFSATYDIFVDKMNIWWPLAIGAILTEFLAPLFLISGFLTRLATLITTARANAAMTYNLHNGFFMNWYNNQKGEGIEYQLLYVGCALALVLMGPGRYSIDKVVLGKFMVPAEKEQED